MGITNQEKPAFLPVSEYFESKWNPILHDAEKNIVKLLMYKSDQVIAKKEVEIQEKLKEEDPNRFRQKINQLLDKHANFSKLLETRRSKKWQKFNTITKCRIQNNTILMEKVTENNNSIKINSNQGGNYPNN